METEATSWAEMADQVVNTWTEVGTHMWKGWADLMGTATRTSTPDTKAVFNGVSQQFIDNQQLLNRLLKLSFSYWQDFLPRFEAGENWQQFLTNYTDQVRKQLNEFSTGSFQANKDTAELWQLYINQMQKFSQLWATAMGAAIAPLSQTAVPGAPEPWIELNNLYWNLLYDTSFGSMAQSPLLGPTREFNSKLLRSFDAWVNLYRAGIDYQILLSNIQLQSFEALMRELVTLAEQGKAVKDWRQFQQIWGQVADGVFEKAFCTEENLKIRGRFLNSLNTYRIYQRSLMEVWMRGMDIPVRSEIDEVHKTIYELRKEVKSLKKSLARYEAQAQITAALSERSAASAVSPVVDPVAPEPPADAPENPASEEDPPAKGTKRSRKSPDL